MNKPANWLAERLRALADSAGWSLAELARAAGMSPSQLNDYLNKGRSPGLDVLERFAGAFGLSLSDLLSGAPVAPMPPASKASLIGEIVSILPALDEHELSVALRTVKTIRDRSGGATGSARREQDKKAR
jgi:transcriptional regulator with XRE-family HTH domain